MKGGAFFDAWDTNKNSMYDPFYGSFPFWLGRYCEEQYRSIYGNSPVSEEERTAMTYLGARQNVKKYGSSKGHRELLSRDYREGQSIVDSLATNPDQKKTRYAVELMRERVTNYVQDHPEAKELLAA